MRRVHAPGKWARASVPLIRGGPVSASKTWASPITSAKCARPWWFASCTPCITPEHESLRVGCVCAGHMEQDVVGARIASLILRNEIPASPCSTATGSRNHRATITSTATGSMSVVYRVNRALVAPSETSRYRAPKNFKPPLCQRRRQKLHCIRCNDQHEVLKPTTARRLESSFQSARLSFARLARGGEIFPRSWGGSPVATRGPGG